MLKYKGSSKQGEWEDKKTTHSKKRSRKRKARKGAGNKAKQREPGTTEKAKIETGEACNNNYAEYPIRIGVLKRKISGRSMSAEGGNAYAVLLSIYTTYRLRQLSFRKFLKASLEASD